MCTIRQRLGKKWFTRVTFATANENTLLTPLAQTPL